MSDRNKNPKTDSVTAFKDATAVELLSALLDGECRPAELDGLLDELDGSPQLKQRWSRMCRVREAMQDTRVDVSSAEFCAGVMAAVRREGAVTAADKVIHLPVRRRVGVGRWRIPAGLAAAASVAALAMGAGYRWFAPLPPAGAPAAVAQVSPADASGGLQPATLAGSQQGRLMQVSASAGDEPVETRWSQLDADTARQLDEYMLEHAHMRAEEGMGSGMLLYPRMTVRTAEYHASEPR